MNFIVKSAVVGALALAGSAAFAGVAPNQASSDVILLVENTTSGASYALDTGVAVSSLFNAFTTGAVLDTTTQAGINSAILADSSLQNFLSTNPASGDGWQLIGAQGPLAPAVANNSTVKVAGTGEVVYTSNIQTTNQGTHTLANLSSIINNLSTETTSGTLTGLTVGNDLTSSTALAPNSIQKYTVVAGDALVAVGATQNFYGFTGNGTTGTLQSYILGTASLGTNGTLSFTGNAPAVPLPASVWLFGSGILGLVGVSRRRKAAV